MEFAHDSKSRNRVSARPALACSAAKWKRRSAPPSSRLADILYAIIGGIALQVHQADPRRSGVLRIASADDERVEQLLHRQLEPGQDVGQVNPLVALKRGRGSVSAKQQGGLVGWVHEQRSPNPVLHVP